MPSWWPLDAICNATNTSKRLWVDGKAFWAEKRVVQHRVVQNVATDWPFCALWRPHLNYYLLSHPASGTFTHLLYLSGVARKSESLSVPANATDTPPEPAEWQVQWQHYIITNDDSDNDSGNITSSLIILALAHLGVTPKCASKLLEVGLLCFGNMWNKGRGKNSILIA